MATKSYLALPPVAAVLGWLCLMLPSGLLAQSVTPGSLADCIDLVDVEFNSYMAVEESRVDSGCIRSQGSAYIFRFGLNAATDVKFYAFADMKQCWIQDEGGVVWPIFSLSGSDVAAWKKWLLQEGCDMVNQPEKRIIFVTSQPVTGDLIQSAKNVGVKGKIRSGLEAADKICTKLANDAGLPGDTYTAWLSDSTAHAKDRVVHSEVPYVLVDNNTQVASNYSSLINASTVPLDHNINRDENGNTRDGFWVLTATTPLGLYNDWSCDNWTATTGTVWAGVTDYTNGGWTSSVSASCDNSTTRLYCLQD